MSAPLTALDALDDLPQARELCERTYRGLGDTVVDVGCGSGRAVGELAARGVRAIGVDRDPAVVGTAAERWPAGEFRVADATAFTRDLVRARADRVPAPRVARRHRNLLLDHGFTDVTAEVRTIVWTGPAVLPVLATLGAGAWFDDQVARARDDRLFVAVPFFLAVGTRGR